MLRQLTCLICILFIAVAQPSAASPQTDAEFIAALLVRNDDYRKMLHERIAAARVNAVVATLSEHSVKVRDFDKLAELLSEFEVSDALIDRINQIVADALLEKIEPTKLALLADHLRNVPRDPDTLRSGAGTDNAERVMTLDEFRQQVEELRRLTEDPAFEREMELFSVGIMLISLAVQASISGNNGPTASELAGLLEVDGVFGFPNRIARKDLIRELRAASP